MKLYILRHGEAADHGDPRFKTDAERPLTRKGIKRTRELADGLRQMDITFDVILSSPLVRARQTAEIVASRLKLGRRLRLTHRLSPAGSYVDLMAQIRSARPRPEAILIVGHEPHLSGLVSLLCTGGSSLGLTLKKGGLVRLELKSPKPARCAVLEWLLTSRHFGSRRARRR